MRRRNWLVAAIVLFGVAAFLMSRGDEPRKAPAPQVEFPRYLRPAEHERMERRRTLAAPEAVPAGMEPEPERAAPPVLDPVLAALPAVPGKSAVVVEANALRHSPIGELLIDCLLKGERGLDDVRERVGFDPLEDIDRVAFGGNGTVLVSGHFAGAKWDEMEPGVRFERYGDKARFFRHGVGDFDSAQGEYLAVWGDELVLFGEDRAEVEAAIDRLEGRRPPVAPAIDEASTYGEIYGILAAEQLAEMIPAEQQALRQRILEAADRVELHVDASGDVAIAADVQGPQADSVRDLGKSLGAALSLARIKAQAEGDDTLAELLELARVKPQGDRFALELALPLEVLEKHLGEACRKRGETPPSAPDAAIEPAE